MLPAVCASSALWWEKQPWESCSSGGGRKRAQSVMKRQVWYDKENNFKKSESKATLIIKWGLLYWFEVHLWATRVTQENELGNSNDFQASWFKILIWCHFYFPSYWYEFIGSMKRPTQWHVRSKWASSLEVTAFHYLSKWLWTVDLKTSDIRKKQTVSSVNVLQDEDSYRFGIHNNLCQAWLLLS